LFALAGLWSALFVLLDQERELSQRQAQVPPTALAQQPAEHAGAMRGDADRDALSASAPERVTAATRAELSARSDRRARSMMLATGSATLVIGLLGMAVARRLRIQVGPPDGPWTGPAPLHATESDKARLLAKLSHDLRTPLNGVLGYAELLRDTSADAEARDFGAIIHSSAEHLQQLVNVVLDLARIETKSLVMQPITTDLGKLLADLEHLLGSLARQRGKGLQLTLDPACPTSIVTDRNRLLQVLFLLLDKAIGNGQDGEVRVLATAQGDGVRLSLTASGATRRPEHLAGRPDAVAHKQIALGEGSPVEADVGPGLPLVRELTERLGGRLALTAEPEVGTGLSIWLPLALPQNDGVMTR
jgi:signal transduction histidine kinase